MTEAIEIRCPECGGFHEPAPNPKFNELRRTACAAVNETVGEVYETFGINRSDGRWDIDDDRGVIRFTEADGRASEAPYGFVGTWETKGETFRWGWDHPGRTDLNGGPALKVHELGQTIGADILTTNMLRLPVGECWHLASITAFAADMPATYRIPAGDNVWWFLAFDRPEWIAS